jgi:hypothetical protein
MPRQMGTERQLEKIADGFELLIEAVKRQTETLIDIREELAVRDELPGTGSLEEAVYDLGKAIADAQWRRELQR